MATINHARRILHNPRATTAIQPVDPKASEATELANTPLWICISKPGQCHRQSLWEGGLITEISFAEFIDNV
jgi:hypothetical protein